MALKGQVPNVYSVGLQNVGSYQVAGIPWITGSVCLNATPPACDNDDPNMGSDLSQHKIYFPYVTKSIIVKNNKPVSNTKILRIHFEPTGSGNVIGGKHFIELSAQETATLDVKCSAIYLTEKTGKQMPYSVVAELTNIPTGRMYELTGSGITE
jgi:hypothetical protein|tara:strand:+ start:6398 stop:6859 length:462 start_codon:yes stop_codon:yes gene_type:complete